MQARTPYLYHHTVGFAQRSMKGFDGCALLVDSTCHLLVPLSYHDIEPPVILTGFPIEIVLHHRVSKLAFFFCERRVDTKGGLRNKG